MSLGYEKAFRINKQIDEDMVKLREEAAKIENEFYDGINGRAVRERLMFLGYLRTIETTISVWKMDVKSRYKESKENKESKE